MKLKIQLVVILILVVLAISLLLSQTANPDSKQLFGLKRLQENAFLNLKSSPEEKVDYMSSLLNTRLKELQNMVNSKKYDYVLPAASRYSTLAGKITDLVITNNLTDKVNSIGNQFLSHQFFLDDLYIAYPKNIPDNVEWKYIQDDFNYLGLYLDKLEKVR